MSESIKGERDRERERERDTHKQTDNETTQSVKRSKKNYLELLVGCSGVVSPHEMERRDRKTL